MDFIWGNDSAMGYYQRFSATGKVRPPFFKAVDKHVEMLSLLGEK